MDTYILTEKIEELQRFLDFVSERDKQLWDKYLKKNMKQVIKTGKGLLWKIEHPVEISYSEITLDSLLKLCEKI